MSTGHDMKTTIDVIKELLRLKDLKERLESCEFAGPLISSMSEDDYKKGRADYLLNKEQAWDSVREAIAREEAQPTPPPSAEREALIKRLRNGSNWLIQGYGDFKDCVSRYDRSPFEAADMLAADAHPIQDLQSIHDAVTIDTLNERCVALMAELASLRAQQVAVPQGWRLVAEICDYERAADDDGRTLQYALVYSLPETETLLAIGTKLFAAPQPPQGDKP